jgi:hypothetical protein
MSDPSGLDGTIDYAAGAGDTLSFGLTKVARRYIGEWLGIGDANEAVDYHSGAYTAGEVSGIALDFAIGGAGGWKAAGEKAIGKEFSHAIPVRVLKRASTWLGDGRAGKFLRTTFGDSKFNGNYVSAGEHAMSDPFRYLKGWTRNSVRYSLPRKIISRTPNVYKGSFGLGGAGIVHHYGGQEP